MADKVTDHLRYLYINMILGYRLIPLFRLGIISNGRGTVPMMISQL